jgi:UDPglucose 6-dehydrogenase
MMPPQTFCVIGTGYVGMASCVGLANLGHRVIGYDIIRERIRGLQRGVSPYSESGFTQALRNALDGGNLTFVESLAEALENAHFILISVGTPSLPDGSTDLSYIDDVVGALAEDDVADKTIVLRSTVPPGTTDEIARRLPNCATIYAPEFLREGSALADFMNPDRIVIGASDLAAAAAYAGVFAAIDRPVLVTTSREAELIKAYSNAYLAMKISFANEVANVCDNVGANALAVLAGIGADHRIGRKFLQPGIGFGGPCFDKDVRALHSLAGRMQSGRELLAATLRVNELQPIRIVDTLETELGGTLSGKSIGVWGLTFKAGTDDLRHSLAIRIVDLVMERGAFVRAYDPTVCIPNTLVRCELAQSAEGVLDSDALLVLTEWPEFRLFPCAEVATRLRAKLVVDGRNVLDADTLSRLGVRYYGVGRSPVNSVIGTDEVLAVS